MSFSRGNGYHEANLVDDQIKTVMSKYPIVPETYLGWLTFLRTVRTSIDILESKVTDSMRLHHRPSGED